MVLPRALGFTGTREWIYPQSVRGSFTSLRRWTFLLLHVGLFAVPWIHVHGHPILLIDLPGRRLHLVGQVFTAADTILLVLLLLFLAFSLFFFTTVFGRIWCGYACPQTVFLESWIRPLEQWIEGDRARRRRLDAQDPTLQKVWRKAAKWGAVLLVALVLGMAIQSFFAGARALWTLRAGAVNYVFVGLWTALWTLDFAWFREQFCIYLCPYARFQSALTDNETLSVAYDELRGEPRGPKRGPKGGCVACGKCVVVCPQGIDIRVGFQLECIQCARCIDACQSVMERFGQPTLVRYSSIAADEGIPRRTFRPRTVVYGGLLTALAAASVVLLIGRTPFEVTVNRVPGSLFQVDGDGSVRNTYLLRLVNKDPTGEGMRYRVRLEGLEGAEADLPTVTLDALQSRTVPLAVRVPGGRRLARAIPFRVRVTSSDHEASVRATFLTGGDHGPD